VSEFRNSLNLCQYARVSQDSQGLLSYYEAREKHINYSLWRYKNKLKNHGDPGTSSIDAVLLHFDPGSTLAHPRRGGAPMSRRRRPSPERDQPGFAAVPVPLRPLARRIWQRLAAPGARRRRCWGALSPTIRRPGAWPWAGRRGCCYVLCRPCAALPTREAVVEDALWQTRAVALAAPWN